MSRAWTSLALKVKEQPPLFLSFADLFIYAGTPGNLLVLVDQHAAHERVRLENLIAGKNELNDNPQDERCNLTEGMNLAFH